MAIQLLPSPASVPRRKCIIAINREPSWQYGHCMIHRDRRLRACAEIGSPVVGGKYLGNGLDSSVPFSENIHRSDPSLDSSSNSLNNGNDFEKPLQELLDEVKTLASTGKKRDAIDLLQANYEAVKEQLNAGYKSIEEAATLDVIALGFVAVGDFKLVTSVLKLLNEVIDGLEEENTILDVVLIHMGSMYSSLGKFEKSSLMYNRALKLLERLYGENSTFLVRPLLGLARIFSLKGKASEAIKNYNRAITILEVSHGDGTLGLVLPLSGLGRVLLLEGKPKDAENHFTRILNIYRKFHGENDGRVGMALCSIAHTKCAQGKAKEAVPLYRKALQIIRDSGYVALDDDIMEQMRIDLAELLHVVGRGEEGRELLEECLVIAEKYKGKEDPSMVTHLINLATSYSLSKKFVQAERTLRMSLQIMEKTSAPDDPSITFPMLRLAITLYHLKQDKEAERLALQVLHVREAAFGQDSLPVGEALDCLVSIQMRTGEDDETLLERLERVLAIQEKGFGLESKEVMLTLRKILFFLNKLGRRHEVLPLKRRLSVLENKHKEKHKIFPAIDSTIDPSEYIWSIWCYCRWILHFADNDDLKVTGLLHLLASSSSLWRV
ncbi:hypothetical protein Dimus_000124 [Dionaea muscipula]